ncbi:TIGR00282 family metallophosphoesterase [Candidatus Dependentiae bacterium]|nr:MAG: TIGR00282 family metallophosphoesterase [Candidatus Dependentiae bacterium]
MQKLRFLFLGDIVGQPGVALMKRWIPQLKAKHKVDAVIVNGENAGKNGKGITESIAKDLLSYGASMITTGNHVWAQEETRHSLGRYPNVLRPINYPARCPGKGYGLFTVGSYEVAVINVQGQAFMYDKVECPLRSLDTILTYISTKTRIILVDFHAEATAEKIVSALYVDGRVSAFVGTHTHVQTADERILPQGTAFITDLGACAAVHSSLGLRYEAILQRTLTQMPFRAEVVKEPPFNVNGVLIDIDATSGKAVAIERVHVLDSEPVL